MAESKEEIIVYTVGQWLGETIKTGYSKKKIRIFLSKQSAMYAARNQVNLKNGPGVIQKYKLVKIEDELFDESIHDRPLEVYHFIFKPYQPESTYYYNTLCDKEGCYRHATSFIKDVTCKRCLKSLKKQGKI